METSQISNFQQIKTVFEQNYESYNEALGGAWSLSKLSAEFEQAKCIGLFDDDLLVSFICYRENPQAFEVSILMTDLKFSGKSYMSKLLAVLIESAKESKKELWLEVKESNQAAISLYKKMGFEPVGKRPNYYADGSAAINFLYR